MTGTSWPAEGLRVPLALPPPGRQDANPPIYAELAQQWKQAGRAVPGVRDPQWTQLVHQLPSVAS